MPLGYDRNIWDTTDEDDLLESIQRKSDGIVDRDLARKSRTFSGGILLDDEGGGSEERKSDASSRECIEPTWEGAMAEKEGRDGERGVRVEESIWDFEGLMIAMFWVRSKILNLESLNPFESEEGEDPRRGWGRRLFKGGTGREREEVSFGCLASLPLPFVAANNHGKKRYNSP